MRAPRLTPSPASADGPTRGRRPRGPSPAGAAALTIVASTVLLPLAGVLLLLLALLFAAAAGFAARRRRPARAALHAAAALCIGALAALLVLLAVATRGYRALTRETTAATVSVEPAGPRRFTARVTLPDGRADTFSIAGEQLYVDAHILKWKPVANVLGLHTAYELDRIGGRYVLVDDERSEPRSIHSLKRPKPLDLFTLRQRYALLGPLVDAEYGSATFIAADRPATFEVRVSTSGLLIRETAAPGAEPAPSP